MTLSSLIRKANRVYVVGNGGSFANSMHIVNDLLSVGVKAYAMDPSTLTAFANDYGYHQCFARWIYIVGEKDDLLIALSGSGKSLNILLAITEAEGKGMFIWKEFGAEKGLGMQAAEERQIGLGHETMMELRNALSLN